MLSNENDFIVWDITDRYRLDVLKKIEGVKYNKSLTDGDRMLHSAICEEVVTDYLDCELSNTFDFDFNYYESKIDVKSNSVYLPPKLNHFCIISGENTHQKCDVYVFCVIHNTLTRVWILGWIRKDAYLKQAREFKAGDLLEGMPNHAKFDGRFVEARELHPMSMLKI